MLHEAVSTCILYSTSPTSVCQVEEGDHKQKKNEFKTFHLSHERMGRNQESKSILLLDRARVTKLSKAMTILQYRDRYFEKDCLYHIS